MSVWTKLIGHNMPKVWQQPAVFCFIPQLKLRLLVHQIELGVCGWVGR